MAGVLVLVQGTRRVPKLNVILLHFLFLSRKFLEISEKVEVPVSSPFRRAAEVEIWVILGEFWVRFLALGLYYPPPFSSFFTLFVKFLLSGL